MQKTILDMLGRKSSKSILKLFLSRPWVELRITDITRQAKIAKMSAIKWTRELLRYGILSPVSRGGYVLNRNNPVVVHLSIAYNIDHLKNRIGKIEDTEVFIYGSFARGENTEKSDIDILVIGKDRGLIEKISKIDMRIKVSFYTPVEWSMMARNDPAFFERVERDKIRLI